MKLLLQNQNIFQKLKNTLNGCIKKFYDTYQDLEQMQKFEMIVEDKLLFRYSCSQSEMFSAQIQAHYLEKRVLQLTDGNVKYIVNFRDKGVLDKANFFDTPNNSLVIIRQWSYEIYYTKNTFQINLVIDEMRCIDIITTIFYCKLELDFTQGIKGISKSSSFSNQIYEYSAQYYKAIQLLKKLLINDSYISELYNSTKSKQQPRLFIFQSFKPKMNLAEQNLSRQFEQCQQDDFGDGCLLQIVNYTHQSLKQIENKNNSNQIVNGQNEISKKKRVLKSNEDLYKISLQKQLKIFQEEEIELHSQSTIRNQTNQQLETFESDTSKRNSEKILHSINELNTSKQKVNQMNSSQHQIQKLENNNLNKNILNQINENDIKNELEERQQQHLTQSFNSKAQLKKIITLKKNQDILLFKPQEQEGSKKY
ncbi:telomerase-associated protein (macronuclear) [Tetrahymena thermophila SB210]|uniref:Telomerase-associated protein of 50 kDa n=1 Tax=Tetrahymena thermophila (strain SB210) TaxID=312017 RepID=TAP50_TETTS|nr:telomerase-associated protein [Tetrahymena thermophila SB210]D2CVN8.1 RecName: Full=Telomerase-associated protein of 50 kDa; Short=p50 [Tetrahymena thermophila SB210]7LMA_G Chain G, Telomerase associated protein p50 [Tetrahymena thermophila]7LMB_G Chain G, Telomerase associated protein p50 [Tetrahymena thermophila]7UY5_G Chain G, Telomerase associated protein p50 [Tetrahymena thermophila]7UY6_G Chain G, Telomerase associated protein p50 [Tetrahymena thermophila]7UY7_D Chain D, Telomerase a|eukprot:XP_001025514.4 telomerase-associated protein [Tetrahymena thermophila SB210]